MTSGRVPGGPSRADAPTRTTGTRDGIGAIVAILALGLVIRLFILQVNPGSGFKVDLASFQYWASNLASEGLSGFYARPFFHDYTPGYLYVLWLVGLVGQQAGRIADLIKIPPILADIAIGWLVWSMAREIGVGKRAALIGAAIAVLNPVSWFDSVVWGQVDSFGVVFLLLGLRALWRDRPERAAIFTVIAALIKPQLAILVPIVAVVTIRRALWPPTPLGAAEAVDVGGPAASPGMLARLRAWELRSDRPIRILTTAAAGLLTAIVLCFPFGLSVLELNTGGGPPVTSGLLYEMFNTASEYPYASVNAYNPWALASVNGNGVASNGTWACDSLILHPLAGSASCTQAVMIGPVSAVVVGALLLIAAFVIVCAIVAWRPTPLTLLVGLAVLAVAFFVLPTRVHERYLFPFMALGAILAAASWRWLLAYVVASVTTFLNMYVVLTTLYTDNPGIQDWLGIGSTVRTTGWVAAIAILNGVVAVWVFSQLRPGGIRALARDVDRSAAADVEGLEDDGLEPDGASAPLRRGPAWAPAVATGDGVATASAVHGGSGDLRLGAAAGAGGATLTAAAAMPTWSAPPSIWELGPGEWLRVKLNERPIRADRSRELEGEPRGRVDRLDVWVMVVLVVASLGLRMFRLSEPYQMHFDEVYHARTTTEFLQDWRYGIQHDIYEWTHPHLAKYAMAAGIVTWGDTQVTGTADLGVPVLDAVIEPHQSDPAVAGDRSGDRVDVATGTDVRAYDLVTRQLIATIPFAGASAVAVDGTGGRVFVGSSDGSIATIDSSQLDAFRTLGSGAQAPAAEAFGRIDGSVRKLFVSPDTGGLLVETTDDRIITMDGSTASVLGTVQLKAAGDLAPGGTSPALIGTPNAVTNPTAAASELASILHGSQADYLRRLTSSADRSVIAGISSTEVRTKIQTAIDTGPLAGLEIDSVAQVAVADAKGVEFIDPSTGALTETVDVGAPAHGLALATVSDPTLYVATDPDPQIPGEKGRLELVVVGGDTAKDGPHLGLPMQMPGAVSRVVYDDATQMVHVLGRTPDDSASTIYVVESHANAVFADAKLPFDPSAWVLDVQRDDPTDDRQDILTFASDGSVASVDTGQVEFAWRLSGVICGALMAGFLYLLARILFRRRSIGVLVAIISIADGMFFVQSRIGMNDAYVAVAIVAAYTVFAALWMGAWKHRGAFWIAMPIIGALLGLGLASKWVALYALGGIAVLIMIRSALGRLVTVISMIGLTAVLGYVAINVPAGTGFGNLPFVALMVALTIIAVVANVTHPVGWSLDELRFAVGAPIAIGGVAMLALVATGHALKADTTAVGAAATSVIPFSTPMLLAVVIFLLGPIAWAAFAVAARFGFGPLAPPPAPGSPAALLPPPSPPPSPSWLRPGAQLGVPVLWMAVCLLALPLGIYIASYIPWAYLDSHQLFNNWPDGHTGQSLLDLTGAMYAYHNGLTAGHPASSPWWAWLFDFKPVWFYQEGLGGNTTAAIYDSGNLIAWWLGVPAIAFAAWQAYARRSLALALVTVGFACQWVSWARIDRASFQYHYYTTLPFLFLALAYFLAELWHGASRRTWLLAKASAAAAILGPAIFWVFDRPLCGFVGVAGANPTSSAQACQPTIPQFTLTGQTLAFAIALGLTGFVLVWTLSRLGGDEDRVDAGDESRWSPLLPLVATAIVATLAITAVRLFVPDVTLISVASIPVEPIALLLGLLLGVPLAVFVLTARDARRFVVGVVVAIIAWFMIEYPNFSALPLPTAIANVYQGVLPTYLYAFQFPVNNTAATVPIHLFSAIPLLLGASMLFLSLVVAYSAWVWRLALAERDAGEGDRYELGGAPGG